MKKTLALALALLIIIMCCACKGDKNPTNSGSETSQNSSVEDSSSQSEDSMQDEQDTDDESKDENDSFENTSSLENKNDSSSQNTSSIESKNEVSSKTESVASSVKQESSENKPVSSQDTEKEPSKENSKVTQGTVEITDTPISENFITVDEIIEYPDVDVEYNTAPSTLDTAWEASGTINKGNSDKQAEELRNQILNTHNTLELYNIKGTVYYVSPHGDDSNDGKTPQTAFRSTKAKIFNMNILKEGDAVLFERGGVWRLTTAIKCRAGVTYGSYGEGEKPTFYGSPYNYADKNFWIPSNRENVWKVSIADSDIGLVVLNHGELVGVKKLNGLIALENNGDYYFNKSQDVLYMYCDKGNPGKVYDDIELGLNKAAFSVSRTDNVTIDNIRVKYIGRFGVDIGTSDYTIITNCEFGFIGGAIHGGTTRLGNGIQAWDGAVGHKVENCWLYQIYDAALTWQGDETYSYDDAKAKADNYKDMTYKDITYKNNLIEYSTYSFEFWHGNHKINGEKMSYTNAFVENFVCSNNISRFAGYGWGKQRADHTGNHICVFERSFPNAKGNKITDNIFDLADSFIAKWAFKTGDNNGDWDISNNTYFHGPNKFNDGMWFGSQSTANSLSSLQSAIAMFEKHPKSVTWVE